MANFTDWYDEVLPHVPGCLQALALNAIRNSAIKFCERSLVWIDIPTPVDITNGVSSYAYVPPDANTLVVQAVQAWGDGVKLVPKSPGELAVLYSDWRNVTGLPEFFTQDDERNLILVPQPIATVSLGLALRNAIKPTRASTTIDDRILEEYLEPIKEGALAEIMGSPGKPYTSGEGANYHAALFEKGIQAAAVRALKGFV